MTERRSALPLLLLWGMYTLLVGRFFYICDDAFISFRYAQNWAAGQGLRYLSLIHI